MENDKRTFDLNNRRNSLLIVVGAGVIFGFILIYQYLYTRDTWADDVKKLREQKDEMFRSAENSPLPDSMKAGFKGLDYFAPDRAFRVNATFVKNQKFEVVQMPQNKEGETEEYIVAGKLEFQLKGEKYQLTAYQQNPKDSQTLFIPFRDGTSGKTTYGGGRYIEDAKIVNEKVDLDFNLAYNPYCVYNYEYICPVPPPENTLKIAVEAGEKTYEPAKP